MPKYELNFGDYWRIIKKRRGIIILAFLAITSFNAIFIYIKPVEYQSSVTVKIEERKTVAGLLLETLVYYGGADTMATEANVIESWPIAEETCRKLALINDKMNDDEIYTVVSDIRDRISTKQVEGTNLIKIIVQANEPVFASKLANTVAQSYVEENFKAKTSEARKLREFIESQLKEASQKLKQAEDSLKTFREKETISGIAIPLQNQLVDLNMQLNKLLQQYTERHPHVVEIKEQIKDLEEQFSSMPEKELQYARLARDVELNEKAYTNLYQKLQDAQIAEAEKGGNVVIVDPAIKPGAPVQKDRITNVLLGGVVGILVGCIIGFVVENIDTSIGAIEEVEEFLKLPVLGIIPNAGTGEKKGKRFRRVFKKKSDIESEINVRLNAYYQPKSLFAEAYRMMRTNLKISSEKKIILVTSAVHQEGKSSVVTNLAIVSAQLGDRTLIMNCDLRRPVLEKTFGIQSGPGLNEVLSNTCSIKRATKGLMNILMGRIGLKEELGTSGLDNLFFITAGEDLPSPAQILHSGELNRVIGEVRGEYSLILMDCPPVLPVTDAILLAPLVDGIILVYQVGRASRQALVRAKSLLEGAGGKIMGVVLNHIHTEESYLTGTYSSYKYYSREAKPSE